MTFRAAIVLAAATTSSLHAASIIETLHELVVIGTKTEQRWIDASGTVLRVDSAELLKLGSQDLAGFARYDPTVSLPFDFSSGDGAFAYGQSGFGSINIRGIEGNRIAIELDGIRQAPQYVSTSFDQGESDGAGGVGRDYFDPAMFDLVEVLKGGGSALYGSDALGGVVAFRTPEPANLLCDGASTGGFARGQYFSANESALAQLGGAVQHGHTAVMLLYAGRDGRETSNRGVEPPNPSNFTSHAGLLKAEHVAHEHTFKLALEWYQRQTDTDVRSAVTSPFPVFNDFVRNHQALERQRTSVRWDWSPSNDWIDALDTHAYWQDSGSLSENQSASLPIRIAGRPIPGTERTRWQEIAFNTRLAGLQTTARKQSGDADTQSHTLMGGLDLSNERSENRFQRQDSGAGAGANQNRTSFAPTETNRAGLFLQDEWCLAKRWFITPGLRLDWQTITPNPNDSYLARLASLNRFAQEPPAEFENLALSPRLNLAWKPTETTQCYASYARGIRNPTAEELSMVFDHPDAAGSPAGSLTVPNPSLQEEQSDALEFGFKADGKAGRFQASIFHTAYSDFIENGVPTGELSDDGRQILTTINRGEAEIYGFELSGSLELGYFHPATQGWQVGFGTGQSIGNNLTDDLPLNTVDPWRTAVFLGYEAPDGCYGGRITALHSAAVERVDDTTNQGLFFRPPAWTTLDLALWWQPTETIVVHLGFNNLLNEQYWLWGSVRRGNGHLGGQAVTDRTTAPGRNFSISITKSF